MVKHCLSNKNINGITINEYEHVISQFADDTTLMLDGTQLSLQAALNTLEIFGSISGLFMNKDKTRIIWIGRKKMSKDKLITTPELTWGETTFDLLGIKFSVHLEDMIEINYNKYTKQAVNIIRHWSKRFLTPLGKVTVVKTFILSKFIHILLRSPPQPQNRLVILII